MNMNIETNKCFSLELETLKAYVLSIFYLHISETLMLHYICLISLFAVSVIHLSISQFEFCMKRGRMCNFAQHVIFHFANLYSHHNDCYVLYKNTQFASFPLQ